jgi:hypothetical protein
VLRLVTALGLGGTAVFALALASFNAVVILDDTFAWQVAAALVYVSEARSSNRKGNCRAH